MSDEEQSKRQRQKERRAAKRVEQERATVTARRKRTAATFGVVVLALGGIGVLLAGQIRGFFDDRAVVAEADERAEEIGCTDIEEMEDLGAGHFQGSEAELAAAPPEAVYDHRPTTSGQHLGQVTITGVYDDYIDERLTTHNLEHGYVVMWWDPELDDAEVAEMQEWAERQIDDGYDHLVAAPYNESLPDGGDVAFTSWGHRQLCDDFDEQVVEAFLVERHNHADAPEAMAGPHLGDVEGEIDPATDAAVFAPFTDAVPGMPANMQDDEADEEGGADEADDEDDADEDEDGED